MMPSEKPHAAGPAKHFFSWSIRRHLVLLVFLGVLPALGVILYTGLETRRNTLASARRDLAHHMEMLSSAQENLANQSRYLFEMLDDLPEVRRQDAKACSRLFDSLMRRMPHYANIFSMDPNGNVIASGVPVNAVNAADRKYFREALETRGFSAGEYAVSRTTGKPAIHFAHPVYGKGGNLLTVIAAALDIRHFEMTYAGRGMPDGSVLLITDHAGVVLHDSRDYLGIGIVTGERSILDALGSPGHEGTFNARLEDGIRRLFAYRKLRLSPSMPAYLLVAVGIPETHIYGVPLKILTHNLLFLCLAAFLAGTTAWVVGNFAIVDRIKALVSVSRQLGNGDLSARTGLPQTGGELGLLAKSFDDMAESLERDISERKRVEEALRHSEERYRLVVENASDAIFVAKDGFITFPNPRLTEKTGYPPEELAAVPFTRFIHPEDREMVADRHRKRLQGLYIPSNYPFRILTKSGDLLWMEIASVRIDWEGQPSTLNFLRDVTQQKRLEAQLIHSQKMEAVGALAGGIAHDFNNLLQAISGYSALAIMDLPEEDRRRSHLKNIEKAAGRASELVRELLAFSRRQETQQLPLDLNAVTVSAVELLRRAIPKTIRVEARLSADLRQIRGAAVQIEQAIMNLGTNARDAMPRGGMIAVETDQCLVSPADPRLPDGAVPGDYALLRVKDTGVGMDAGTMDKMFDPFFTTKEVGTGTGLGLSTVYGIVRSHGGWILCESEPGRGACFEIFFPSL
jgi:PAS domain S-box-containing protein